MAAIEVASPDQTVSSNDSPSPEVIKESPLVNLMDKLRAKSSQYKAWGEISKAMRIAITEKRHIMDNTDRTQLQKVLDILQKSIKVSSLQSMIERLDSISRQQGLKFSSGPPNTECYISSDIFYVEIVLETSGEVKDVKIFHHGEPETCPELVKVLRSGNFAEFTKHLEGLAAIYQLNADKKQKTKAYLSLQALEEDLASLSQLQSSFNDPVNVIFKCPVGILQRRRGGYSLKITYFISPYDLLDLETNSSIPLTVDAVIENCLGNSVTVGIESSATPIKLQTMSLMSLQKEPDGRSLPSFAALSNLNSTSLPANFVLKLTKPIPMAASIFLKIQGITRMPDGFELPVCQPLLSVIVKDASDGKIATGDQGLCVTLPDQHHCYFLSSSADLQGFMMSSIRFNHPTSVPQILVLLRQQMLFNSVISSCVRPSSKKDADSPFMFEVMAYSTSHILISFEHPVEESLATVDMDLRDVTRVSCKVFTLGSDQSMCTDDYASKIMQRCLSIPITMRAVIRKAHGQQKLIRSSNQGDMYCATVSSSGPVPYLSHIPNYSNSLANGSSFSGGDFSNLASRMCNKLSQNTEISNLSRNTISADNQSFGHPNPSSHAVSSPSVIHLDSSSSLVKQEGFDKSDASHANAMLRSMLSDVPSANSTSASFPFLECSNPDRILKGKSRKRKRKGTEAPKQKSSEEDYRFTPDGEICDSPVGFDVSSSLPASFPSTSREQPPYLNHPTVKSEPPAQGYPQRSASTDSYLIHNDIQSRQVLNINDCSRMSEGGTPNNAELIRTLSQVKNQYFSSDNILEFNKGFLANCETTFLGPPDASRVEADDKNSFNAESIQCNAFLSKFNSGEKSSKKKKTKEKSELSVNHDYQSSDESSIDDTSQKSFSETETSQSEDSCTFLPKNFSQEPFMGTSLKIAKSGDGHKVSKSELKVRHKESKRTSDGSDPSKKKGDGKKEKKRKRTGSADSSPGRSLVRAFHPNIDSSLMPPPASSSEALAAVAPPSYTQPIRPITLNVKSSPLLTSSSSFLPKPSPSSKKSSCGSAHFPKSNVSKSYSSEKVTKSSSPLKTTHFPSPKISSSESEAKKGGSPGTVKVPSKHKLSSNSKGNSSGCSSSGRASPNKSKSTLKLKNFTLPSSITVTPIAAKATLSSPTVVSSSDCGMSQASPGDPGSPGTSNSKANKSALRSRKSSLSAVIDKLRVTATNAQHIIPGLENSKYETVARSESSTDRKESKLERKDNAKEAVTLKGNESKSKFSSSDQFTVKQSSQGIKLTVTKTRATDGSSKSSKSKPSKNSNVSSSGTSNTSKPSSSSGNTSKSGITTSASKKIYSTPPNMVHLIKPSVAVSNPPKPNVTSTQKVNSPSSTSPRVASSANSLSKSAVKHVISSMPNKVNASNLKLFDKTSVSVAETPPESKEKVSTSTMGVLLMNKSSDGSSRSSSRVEEASVQPSPRNTPPCESSVNDPEAERVFKTLLPESCNSVAVPKSIDLVSGAIDYCKSEEQLEQEEKLQWVSSSSDVKPSITARMPCFKASTDSILLDFDFASKVSAQLEVSSSKAMNAHLVSSTKEEVNNVVSRAPSRRSTAQSEEDSSSPEDGLVIDYPDTPRLPRSPPEKKWAAFNSTDDRNESSPFHIKSPFQPSPLKSPVITPPSNHSLSSSLSRPSPYLIDDELMDEALMSVSK